VPKVKITVSIDEDLRTMVDRHARRLRQNRSRLIEEAIRLWRAREMEKHLKEGYLAMSREDSRVAEANLSAGLDAIS
jgi:metal-responsive CopG/Arc/MetJ family transcriptional regulator